MSLQTVKAELKKLVIEDLEETLKGFQSILNANSKIGNTVILQFSRFNSLKKNEHQRLDSSSNINLGYNQLRNALLSMIDDIEEKDWNGQELPNTQLASPANTNNNETPIPSTNSIYISYAWGGASEDIVNLIDTELKNRGVTLIRDKRDLGYKGSIKGFMEDLGKGNKVIVVISKKYLESPNCMFELSEIYKNEDFARRIFPIVLEDANIYNPIGRIAYIKHWDEKIKELNEAIRTVDLGLNLSELQTELNTYGEIRATFDKMSFILKDMNTLSPDMHRNQNFDTLYRYLL